MLRVGRPRQKHKDLPKGFRQVAARWYWRPTDATTTLVASRLRERGIAAPGFADKAAARAWWVKTVLPLIDMIAPENPPDTGTFDELINLYKTNGMTKKGGKPLRERTAKEYEKHLEVLAKKFGSRRYARSEAEAAIGDYIRKADIRRELAEASAPILANRRIAVMSSVFRHGINHGRTEYNPCLQVEKNSESKRERYIETSEVDAVYDKANDTIKNLIDWMYATLQRDEDVIKIGPANVRRTDAGVRFLQIKQSKTGAVVNIEITPEIDALIERAKDNGTVVFQTYIRRRDGDPYTPSGIDSMWQRACKSAGIKDFGARDLRGKAATDMLAQGAPMEHIQRLLGHADITTTRIYIKRYSATPIRPTTSRVTALKKEASQ